MTSLVPLIPGAVRTIGAVTGDAVAIPIPADMSRVLEVSFRGHAVSGGGIGRILGATFVNVAGVVTQVGTTSSIMPEKRSPGLVLANEELVIVGTTVVPRVTGVAGETINWTVEAHVW